MQGMEMIYIIVFSVIALYAVFLTVMLIVISRKLKKTNIVLGNQIAENSQKIESTKKDFDEQLEKVDNRIQTERENTDKKIGEIFDNTMTATSMLIDEKTKNITDKMDDIALKLNIMDCAVKNIEREKVMIHSLITDGEQPVEVEYHDVPKENFMNNARKAMRNAAKSGSRIVSAIKNNFPDIAKSTVKFIKK